MEIYNYEEEIVVDNFKLKIQSLERANNIDDLFNFEADTYRGNLGIVFIFWIYWRGSINTNIKLLISDVFIPNSKFIRKNWAR